MFGRYDWTNLREFMDRLCRWRIPGNAITIYHHGKEVFRYSSGFENVETRNTMRENMLINIYSCSKVTTVVAALQLYEKGYFLLSDPLYEYIPEYLKMMVENERGHLEPARKPITIQNLFTMTAGFGYPRDCGAFMEAKKLTGGHMNTLQVIRCFAKQPLHFEPGTRWNYSFCHDVLGALVETVSGVRFADYVRLNIFDPLQIEGYFHLPKDQETRLATQYEYVISDASDMVNAQQKKLMQEGHLRVVDQPKSMGVCYDSGGGGIITTVEDYAKLAGALSMGGRGRNGEVILAHSTVRLLQQNQLTPTQMVDFNWPQLIGYGYGLGVRTIADKALAGFLGKTTEFGWGGAAGATLLADTDEELGYFYSHHMLNPQEAYYQPRLRNVVYSCLR